MSESSLYLPDAELVGVTARSQPAAQARQLDRLKVPYARRIDGSVLVWRHDWIATQPDAVPPAEGWAAPDRHYEGSGLARAHDHNRRETAERAFIESVEQAFRPRLTATQLLHAKQGLQQRRKEARAALVRFHAARRRVAKLKRTPPWANQDAIRMVYLKAREMTAQTGMQHHVDHIIPLQGVLVSGLHVETNLQVLPWRENIQKRNVYEVDA